MDRTFRSGDVELASHLARPPGFARVPGLVLCHGFPGGPGGAATSGVEYPHFADRLAQETGWAVLTFNFRGCGASGGDFSIGGWLDDLRAATDFLDDRSDVASVWLAGSSLGGALAVSVAPEDPRVRGVATLATPASLRDWASNPARLLAHARQVGVVKTAGFPPDEASWAKELGMVDPVAAARKFEGRPLLVMQGDADEVVSPDDARAMADACPTSELRLFHGAGHRLRHDPRAVACLAGWMARQLP